MLPAEGREPVIAEPVEAELLVKVPGAATAYPLDPTGRRRAPVQTETRDGLLRVNPASARSVWLEVVVE